MKTLLLPKEVAPMLRISISQLCRLTKAGKIPAKDLGTGKNHLWRYQAERLEKWLSEEPSKEMPPKHRKRKSTPVQRSPRGISQASEIKNENGEAHGTLSPVNPS